MRQLVITCLLLSAGSMPLAAQDVKETKLPSWDARGLGLLPRMGITSLDVSDDGKEIVVGTIAAFGDPNVIVLNDAGTIVRTYKVGQQWIDNVAFVAGSKEVLAICTMPAGRAGDRVEAFRCLPSPLSRKGAGGERTAYEGEVVLHPVKHEGVWFFHYGDHSNHPTMKLARAKNATALLAGNQLVIYRKDKASATLRVPVNEPDASVSLAVDDAGWAVVGCTATDGNNLHLFDPDQKKPVWSRAVNKDVDKAPPLEKGLYGTPTLPDGNKKELPQRDEKVWAPLSVAVHFDGKKRLIAAADYQGWQRWVRSSATMRDDNQGLRFVPTKPTVTIHDGVGKVVEPYSSDKFTDAFWSKLTLNGEWGLNLTGQSWRSRGLAGRAVLSCDPKRADYKVLDGKLDRLLPPVPFTLFSSDNANERYYIADEVSGRISSYKHPIRLGEEKVPFWQIDLNKAIPKSPKPWVANARATPIEKGVWQIPGGRVESDLGGQRVIEAPDGLILIEGHAGLSFEREWAAMEAVGLDPKKVKYVLATHEHGDHAPGAYLWRIVTGAKFVCSEEMAYTLQHHIPLNTGYGLHPPVPTDVVIKKDTELYLAGLKVRAIRIPGHTFGSMAWHFERSGKSFVAFGDLIMPRGVLGYAGSVNFSATDILSSLRKLHDLKIDYVLPGHGAVEGPANYFHAGIDVGRAVGWGYIRPERPDPRFRITQKNVAVVGFGHGATSAAFGDVNGDGKPDVLIVSQDGDGSIVKFFHNHKGEFKDQPDREFKVKVSQPHKIRHVMDRFNNPKILVAGKTAVILSPSFKKETPSFTVEPVDISDGNHLRYVHDTPLVSRRFGGFHALKPLKQFAPEIDGPYVDFYMIGHDILTSYGKLYRGDRFGGISKLLLELPIQKDWTFLSVGDFNGDGKPDAAFLSYGMDKQTAARVFYGTGNADRPFMQKADAVILLNVLLAETKKNQNHPLVRDTPVVFDWNGDGIDDLIVAHGQSDEVLVFLGAKVGLRKDSVQRINLEYRVHYEHGVYVGDFNGDGKADLAVFGYTNTGVGAGGPPAVYIWLQ